MIIGLGTDIAEIERIEKVLGRSGDALAKRLLTPQELTAFAEHKQPARFLAKRFAAKEAAVKALGTGIAQGVSFQHFTITHDELGKPLLQVSGVAKEIANRRGICHWHLSISDEKHYAMATVIAEA